MSKCSKAIPLSNIARIAVVQGNGRLVSQVKQDTGCNYCVNGGFYDLYTGKPVNHLKADGTVLATEPWGCWGYAWDSGGDICMGSLPWAERLNYIGAIELLSPAVSISDPLGYLPEVGGKRGRTAVALTEDELIFYCSGDGTADAITPESLRNELHFMGAITALMLDGGGSSQCDFGSGDTIYSTRTVNSYICVWLKSGSEEGDMNKKVCLDPGHGVETAGKCAPDGSYYEHEFNLDMAKRLKVLLERHGVAVTLTRTDTHDVNLEQRVQTANGISDLSLFVSLHSNASGDGTSWTTPDGYGIYTSAAGVTANRNIAANKVLAKAKEANIKLWGDGLYHERWYVCVNAVAPAILIEHGFHTNKAETGLLKTDAYRQKLATVDCKGILDYLGIAWVDEPSKPWYDADKKWVVENGISDGTRPEENITRAEVWAMLRRLFNIIM